MLFHLSTNNSLRLIEVASQMLALVGLSSHASKIRWRSVQQDVQLSLELEVEKPIVVVGEWHDRA